MAPVDPLQAERRKALLGELAEIGMALVRDLPRQAAEPDADMDRIALTYARLARAVRQSLALEARFEAEGLEWAGRAASQRGARRKRQVERLVTQAIEAEFSEDVAEHLVGEMDERLLDDLDSDYADAPLPILVARICKDLGVPFDPTLWEEEEDTLSPVAASPSGHPGFAAGEDRDPSAPASPGDPPPSALLDGPDKPGHDEQMDILELEGDCAPPRPSG